MEAGSLGSSELASRPPKEAPDEAPSQRTSSLYPGSAGIQGDRIFPHKLFSNHSQERARSPAGRTVVEIKTVFSLGCGSVLEHLVHRRQALGSSPRTIREKTTLTKSPAFCALGGHLGLTLPPDTQSWGKTADCLVLNPEHPPTPIQTIFGPKLALIV